MLPATAFTPVGILVPIPTLPLLSIRNASLLPISIVNALSAVIPLGCDASFNLTPLLSLNSPVLPTPAFADCVCIKRSAWLLDVSDGIEIDPPITGTDPVFLSLVKFIPLKFPSPEFDMSSIASPATASTKDVTSPEPLYTWSFWSGLSVPIPTLPSDLMWSLVSPATLILA